MKRTGGEGGGVGRSHESAPKMCIIYSHGITGESSSFTGGLGNYFAAFFSPLNESLFFFKKSLKTERNCYLVPHKRIWRNRGIPSSSGQHEH